MNKGERLVGIDEIKEAFNEIFESICSRFIGILGRLEQEILIIISL